MSLFLRDPASIAAAAAAAAANAGRVGASAGLPGATTLAAVPGGFPAVVGASAAGAGGGLASVLTGNPSAVSALSAGGGLGNLSLAAGGAGATASVAAAGAAAPGIAGAGVEEPFVKVVKSHITTLLNTMTPENFNTVAADVLHFVKGAYAESIQAHIFRVLISHVATHHPASLNSGPTTSQQLLNQLHPQQTQPDRPLNPFPHAHIQNTLQGAFLIRLIRKTLDEFFFADTFAMVFGSGAYEPVSPNAANPAVAAQGAVTSSFPGLRDVTFAWFATLAQPDAVQLFALAVKLASGPTTPFQLQALDYIKAAVNGASPLLSLPANIPLTGPTVPVEVDTLVSMFKTSVVELFALITRPVQSGASQSLIPATGAMKLVRTASSRVPMLDVFLEICGPADTATEAGVRNTLPQYGITSQTAAETLTPGEVAAVILMMLRMQNSRPPITSPAAMSAPSWNLAAFVGACRGIHPGLDWPAVGRALDSRHFRVSNAQVYAWLVDALKQATSDLSKSALSGLFYPWHNAFTQITFFFYAVQAQPALLHLAQNVSTNLVPDKHSALTFASEKLRLAYQSQWNCRTIFSSAITAAEQTNSTEASLVLQHAKDKEPLLCFLGLIGQELRLSDHKQLLVNLAVRLLEVAPLGICGTHLLPAERAGMFIQALAAASYHRPYLLPTVARTIMRRPLVLLKAALDSRDMPFTIDIRIHLSRLGFVQLKTLLEELNSCSSSEVSTIIQYYHSLLEHEMMWLTGNNTEPASKDRPRWTNEELEIMMDVISQWAEGKHRITISQHVPTIRASLSAILERRASQFGPPPSSDGSKATSSEERKALLDGEMMRFYEQLYATDSNLNQLLDMLEELKLSPDSYNREIQIHIAQGALDEEAHFGNYPPAAQDVTAQLFGQMLLRHLFPSEMEDKAIGILLKMLNLPKTDQLHLFGSTAISILVSQADDLPKLIIELASERFVKLSVLFNDARLREVTHIRAQELVEEQRAVNQYMQSRFNEPSDTVVASSEEDSAPFTAVSPGTPPGGSIVLPDAETRDQLQFVINNVSMSNIEEKMKEMRKLIEVNLESIPWLSRQLVITRASQEPNYHPLYHRMLDVLDNDLLRKCVLHETLVAIQKLLNASESQIMSQEGTSDRKSLKNLGSWLGGLTLARNRPLLHEFADLKGILVQGFSKKRMAISIPFVCKVLEQTAFSRIFHKPQPWLMAILSTLKELYEIGELKLNQKFEIEVLFKALDISLSDVEPATFIRQSLSDKQQSQSLHLLTSSANQEAIARDKLYESDLAQNLAMIQLQQQQQQAQQAQQAQQQQQQQQQQSQQFGQTPTMNDAVDNDMSRPSFDIVAELRRLASFTTTAQLVTAHPQIKNQVLQVMHLAISEAIAHYLRKAVMVAVTTTRDTVLKDFATDGNVDRLQRAAISMARSIAGGFIVAQTRETLQSMTIPPLIEIFIQSELTELTAQAVATSLVNENIDLMCALVEHEAKARATTAILSVLAESIQQRRSNPAHLPFTDNSQLGQLRYPPNVPDTLKIGSGSASNGVPAAQLQVYEEFDSVVQNQAAAIAQAAQAQMQAATYAEAAAAAAAAAAAQNTAASYGGAGTPGLDGNLASIAAGGGGGGALGFDSLALAGGLQGQQAMELFSQTMYLLERNITIAVQEMEASSEPSALPSEEALDRIRRVASEIQALCNAALTSDVLLVEFAQSILSFMFRHSTALGLEVYAALLARVCESSPAVAREVGTWLLHSEDDRRLSVPVTLALFKGGLLAPAEYDAVLALQLKEQARQAVLDFTVRLIRQALFTDALGGAVTVGAFTHSIGAINKLVMVGRASEAAIHLLDDIHRHIRGSARPPLKISDEELIKYRTLLQDWVQCVADAEDGDTGKKKTPEAFVTEMLGQIDLQNAETHANLFRMFIESAVDAYQRDAVALAMATSGSTMHINAYSAVDAVASFVFRVYNALPSSSKEAARVLHLQRVLGYVTVMLMHDHEFKQYLFVQKPYHRFFSRLLESFASEKQSAAITKLFTSAFELLPPSRLSGFAFAWLSLISHRDYLPRLLSSESSWPVVTAHFTELFNFLGPYVSQGDDALTVRFMYRGVVRVFVLIQTEFPDYFTCNHLALLNMIPPTCIQFRNLVLSAVPSNRSSPPEPLTPGLVVQDAAGASQPPRILTDAVAILEKKSELKAAIDAALASRKDDSFATTKTVLDSLLVKSTSLDSATSATQEATSLEAEMDDGLANAMVVYIGIKVQGNANTSGTPSLATAATSLLTNLCLSLVSSSSGNSAAALYTLLSAIANQLRDPNTHTLFFSSFLLSLYANPATKHIPASELDVAMEQLREQILRVLIERVIVNRPYPWGVLVTVIELLRDPQKKYPLWKLKSVQESEVVRKLLEAFATTVQAPIPTTGTPSSSATSTAA
ncbi:Not1-domain-containing protein [Ramicandelaber brevisporus]|nr:Not1-domain-containing protein [Ramicandelaber brevisporus]